MRAFRSLLIWMMLAILPAQGILAAAMMPLAPGCPQHPAAARVPGDAPPATAMSQGTMGAMAGMHGMHDAAMPCHPAASASLPPAAHGATAHGQTDHTPHDHAKCGACPACCAGLALAPVPAPPPHGIQPSYIPIPFRAGHVTSADLALPERPPRASLA
jgi:hypothetical protein